MQAHQAAHRRPTLVTRYLCVAAARPLNTAQGVNEMTRTERNLLSALLLAYLGASFLHFAHHAEFLGDYPNLPASLTRSTVYLTWTSSAAIGTGGFALYLRGWHLCGLLLIGLYAAFGFDGLLHYARAPFDSHTVAMNFTIWFEVVAAAALLVAVVFATVKRLRRSAC